MNLVDYGDHPPRFCLIDFAQAEAERIDQVLAESGWIQAPPAASQLVNADIILLRDGADDFDFAPSLLPRIALIGAGESSAYGFDEVIDSTLTDADIRARIDRWRPTLDTAYFHAVAEAFGREPLRPVARGLADQLAKAIAGLDAGKFDLAHRIAGLAGTLGFKRVSRAWIAIDEGDLSDLAGARREARLAQVALARWLAD